MAYQTKHQRKKRGKERNKAPLRMTVKVQCCWIWCMRLIHYYPLKSGDDQLPIWIIYYSFLSVFLMVVQCISFTILLLLSIICLVAGNLLTNQLLKRMAPTTTAQICTLVATLWARLYVPLHWTAIIEGHMENNVVPPTSPCMIQLAYTRTELQS